MAKVHQINNHSKVENGAELNVVSKAEFNTLKSKSKLPETDIKLTAYNNTKITIAGNCELSIERLDKSFNLPFIVVEVSSPSILSADLSIHLKLVKQIISVNHRTTYFFSEYSNCFGELGLLPEKYHIRGNPEISPVIRSARRNPLALRDKNDIDFDKMLNLRIIVPVNEPNEWVNQLVVTEKPNGKLRICLNPSDLNEAILRERYEMPTAEQLYSEM